MPVVLSETEVVASLSPRVSVVASVWRVFVAWSVAATVLPPAATVVVGRVLPAPPPLPVVEVAATVLSLPLGVAPDEPC